MYLQLRFPLSNMTINSIILFSRKLVMYNTFPVPDKGSLNQFV